MNTRIFFITLSTLTSVLLFFIGVDMLTFLNAEVENKKPLSKISKLIEPFKEQSEIFNKKSNTKNILIFGGDEVNKNTDTMLLVNINHDENKVFALSIPRDTRIVIKNEYAKVNAAYPKGGVDLTKEVLENLLKVKIDKYIYFDTKIFKYIIDELGGVKYYVPVDMDYDDSIQKLHIHLKKGYQLLNGAKAEQFMRFRKYNTNKEYNKFYNGSDLKRIDAQQKFIKEFIDQKTNFTSLTKIRTIMSMVIKNVETDLILPDIMKILNNKKLLKKENIHMFKLPGKSINGKTWFYVANKNNTSQIIKYYFQGKDIKKFDPNRFRDEKSGSSSPFSRLTDDELIYYEDINPSNDESDTTSSGIEGLQIDIGIDNPSNDESDTRSSGIEGLRSFTSEDNPSNDETNLDKPYKDLP